MKHKLSILLLIFCLVSFQNADAQIFKKAKARAKQKAKELENKALNKLEKEAEKTIDKALEGKNDPNAGKPKVTKNEKDFGDVIIKHSKKYGSVQIEETSKVKVTKTNAGYTIRGNWWSHEADIYDGFTITIKTDKNLKHDTEEAKNRERLVFRIPEDASLSIGYDPQLPYNKKSEDDFKRAVTDDYQNYDISKGEVAIDVLTDEAIQISFSGMATLREVIRKVNSDDYSETFYEASITGGIDSKTPEFFNKETITKSKNDKQETTLAPTYKTKDAVAGTYNFTHETVTKITVPDQNRTYKMSYLLNPNASYVGIKVDMSEYSDEGMNGESIIVMDKGNTHIFVETAGMKMRMSNGMMGQQKMENPTDQMMQYDYAKLTKTGNTKTILGATCYEYTMSDNTTKINLWIAPDINIPNWFAQNSQALDGHIMEYTLQSKEGTMRSEVIEIKDHISKTINPKEYKKMF